MKKNIIATLAILALLIAAFGSGAVAANTVGSGDIKNGAIKAKDLRPALVKRLDQSKEVVALQSQVDTLKARLDALAANGGSGNRQPWVASNPDSKFTATAITMTGGNTSVETNNLDVPVQAGDLISFHVDLDGGATCTGGAPRMFIETQGVFTNSWDQNIGAGTQCGNGSEITFHAPSNGRIGQAGFVYDNGGTGVVTISDLIIDGNHIPFA